MKLLLSLAFLLCLSPTLATAQDAVDRIYGTVLTRDGDTFEGIIRWDKNEASWVDVLDGDKTFSNSTMRKRRRVIEVFGIAVAEFEEEDTSNRSRASGIRFGHISSLENIGSNRAHLTLRSGQRVEFRGGGTDIGNDNRSIIIEDPRRGEVELGWRDIERIDFNEAPPQAASRYGERLFGTLITRDGMDFTGYICWDIDEVLGDDVLDGEDESGYDRKIRFANIDAIERNNSSSARVILTIGDVLTLSGTNDVNSRNNDIMVLDPSLGQVRVPWNEFDRVSFSRPVLPVDYQAFQQSGPLRGAVRTVDGSIHEGLIRWDNDEEAGWEMLNGDIGGVDFSVEFGMISEIERLSSREARIILRDGRTYELSGSNDVNNDNDGIYVIRENGDELRISWSDFERVTFDKP